ncbi:ABC transporter substrate-binding protein [Haloferax marisrubri]|uniref:ABC transporter substrate-binding protein n=1 Tax=Haloferax marisrubri TaxID=1544719 RepID=A0A2P4NRM1_9EURY|nr:ABC transporter substrate-binding protein [Haloferax marisrubri]POG55786.1 ABC transporter substrate-binding protein [Haloferax marisrubri]
MEHDANGSEPTRRTYLKYGGVLVGSGLLTGCTGSSNSESGPTTPEPTTTEAQPQTADNTQTTEATTEDGSYTVSIEPMGDVEFDAVPERWSNPGGPAYLDMAIALGKGDGLVATGFGLYPGVAFEAAGVSPDIDPSSLPVLWQDGGFSKEVFYEADADVHFADPNYLAAYGMSEEDIDEVTENVAPFFGAYSAREREWNADYLYSLYDLFDKVAEVFQEEARSEQFRRIHDEMMAEISARLPPEDERPTVGVLFVSSDPEDGSFRLLPIRDRGFRQMHYRAAGFEDAWASMDVPPGEYPTVGYEALLETDPDVLIYDGQIPSGMESTDLTGTDEWRAAHVTPMAEDNVGSNLTAVQSGAVYPGGPPQAGPILNLFNTERTVKQVYPDVFDADEALFDRQRVGDVVNGTF